MKAHRRLIVLVAIMGACGCRSGVRGTPFDAALMGREAYLCCNLHFSPDALEARDANYVRYRAKGVYVEGPMLAAGTRVKIVAVGESAVAFEPDNSTSKYTLTFRYGRNQQSPATYFRNVLRTTDPLDPIKGAPASIAAAVREGRLVAGMTKEEAIIARGYPPAHRTPSLESDEWLYYDSLGFVDHVVFVGGKIQSITRGPAPQ